MKDLLKKIKKILRHWLLKDITIEGAESSPSYYTDILTLDFKNYDLVQEVSDELVKYIVVNGYNADTNTILSLFHKRMPELSIGQFAVLSFKLGALVHIFATDPVALLTHALNMKDVFDPRTVQELESKLQSFKGIHEAGEHLRDTIESVVADMIYPEDEIEEEGMEEKGLETKNSMRKSDKLKFAWNPIRINRLGTMEIRGLDSNHPKNFIAASVLMKFIFRKVHQEFTKVKSSETGIKEPFKIEDNTLHIPPYSHVYNELQPKSAFGGLKDKEVFNYVKKLMAFAKKCVYEEYYPAISPFMEMLSKKETISDELIKLAKKKGQNLEKPLQNEIAEDIALHNSDKLVEGISQTAEKIENLD